MHLVPKSKLFGLPARAVRDFLRHVGLNSFDEVYLQVRLKIGAADAAGAITKMLADQVIDHALPRDETPMFGVTIRGRLLAAASFAPQISREEGESLLSGVLARAADFDAQRPFAFQVSKVAFFGSMLGTAPMVSDVDIAVELVSPYEGSEYIEVHQRRIELAEMRGKRFSSRFASIVWPRMEAIEFLRGGERYISIHSFAELELLNCPFEIVFEGPSGGA
jgi:predicted nucleotidyltransferase